MEPVVWTCWLRVLAGVRELEVAELRRLAGEVLELVATRSGLDAEAGIGFEVELEVVPVVVGVYGVPEFWGRYLASPNSHLPLPLR